MQNKALRKGVPSWEKAAGTSLAGRAGRGLSSRLFRIDSVPVPIPSTAIFIDQKSKARMDGLSMRVYLKNQVK